LLRHVERVAAHVHRILGRPAEHPPLAIEDQDDFGVEADPEAVEKQWDELSKHNHRQQERLQRAIEERLSRGLDAEIAFREALKDVVPSGFDAESDQSEEPWLDDDRTTFGESFEDEAAVDDTGFRDAREDCFEIEEQERHPLLQHFDELFRVLQQMETDIVAEIDSRSCV
jgi:hypothetical protein